MRIPLNTSFTSLIHLHNPHNATLQILEIYSSDDDLHLEIPTYPLHLDSNSNLLTHSTSTGSGTTIMYDTVAELRNDEDLIDIKDTDANSEDDLLIHEGHYHLINLNEKNLWVGQIFWFLI